MSGGINAVNLKPKLRQIQANRANLHVGGSFMVVFDDNHLGTSMPGVGAVHPIKIFAPSASPRFSNGFHGAEVRCNCLKLGIHPGN
jgi:hypothetical protein